MDCINRLLNFFPWSISFHLVLTNVDILHSPARNFVVAVNELEHIIIVAETAEIIIKTVIVVKLHENVLFREDVNHIILEFHYC